jgi:hypothetical protein
MLQNFGSLLHYNCSVVIFAYLSVGAFHRNLGRGGVADSMQRNNMRTLPGPDEPYLRRCVVFPLWIASSLYSYLDLFNEVINTTTWNQGSPAQGLLPRVLAGPAAGGSSVPVMRSRSSVADGVVHQVGPSGRPMVAPN